MKNKSLNLFKTIFALLVLAGFCLTAWQSTGQTITLTKTFNLPEQAVKGTLIYFDYDEAAGNYLVTYSVGKKKEIRIESFVFDKDFNFLRSEVPTDLTVETATSRYPYYDFNEGSITAKTRKETEGEITDNSDKSVQYKYLFTKKTFSLTKLKEGKIVYEKQIPFSQFEEKFKFPPSGDKGKPCNEKSKNYIIVNHHVTPEGHLFILGQNKDKGGILGGMQAMQEGSASTKYRDCFILHFDPDGNLVSQYSYDTKWSSNLTPCEQYLLKGKKEKHVYWMILPNYYDAFTASNFNYFKPDICLIDFNTATMSDFVKFQKEIKIKEFKYLDPLYPFLTPEPGVLVLLGKDKSSNSKSGNVISFVKIDMD